MHLFKIWSSALFPPPSTGTVFVISRIQDFYLRKGVAVLVFVSNALALLLSRHGFRPSSCVPDTVRVFSVLWWRCAVVIFQSFVRDIMATCVHPYFSSRVTLSSDSSASQSLIFKTCYIELLVP